MASESRRRAAVFADTEFSDLLSPTPQLISVGLVAEAGRTLYVELEYDEKACSEFVRDAVIPLLSGPKASREDAAQQILAYLSSFGFPVDLWTEEVDVPLVADLLAPVRTDLPDIEVRLPEFASALARMTFAAVFEQSYDGGALRRHQALDDAKALRFAWLAVQRLKPREIRDAPRSAFESRKPRWAP